MMGRISEKIRAVSYGLRQAGETFREHRLGLPYSIRSKILSPETRARLEAALARADSNRFEIEKLPFELKEEQPEYEEAQKKLYSLAQKNNIDLEDVERLWKTILPAEARFQQGRKSWKKNQHLFRRYDRIKIGEHVPPQSHRIPGIITAIVNLLNEPHQGAEAVEKAIQIHHLLVWLHAYPDGNGRLARTLARLKLLRSKLPVVAFAEAPEAYVTLLDRANRGNPQGHYEQMAEEYRKRLKNLSDEEKTPPAP